MSDVTLEQVRAAITYDPITGAFAWTPAERSRRRSDTVGTIAANGYLMLKLHGKLRLAHRLAWLLHHGRWPSHFIDHMNGIRADNRMANLRDVPHEANMRNRRSRPILVGAIPTGNGTWRAAVHEYGGSRDLGKEYATAEEANAAWEAAKQWVVDPEEPRPKLRLRYQSGVS